MVWWPNLHELNVDLRKNTKNTEGIKRKQINSHRCNKRYTEIDP